MSRYKKSAGTIKESDESYDDLLKVLGFKPGTRPTYEEIKLRYKKLARIYHPDLAAPSQRDEYTDRMSRINQAKMRLVARLDQHTLTPGWEKYYRLFSKQLTPYASADQLEKSYIALLKGTKSTIEQDKIKDAYGVFESARQRKRVERATVRDVIKKRFGEASRMQFDSPEDRATYYAQQKAQRIGAKSLVDKALDRIPGLVSTMRYRKGKPHVPIKAHDPNRGRTIRRFVLLTGSLAIAILGGKYLWDRYRRVYLPRKLLPAPVRA